MHLLTDVRALPAVARRLLTLSMLNNLGTGLILPFLVIYVHDVNGLSLRTATTVIAVVSTSVVIGSPLAGWLADRFGADFAAAAHLIVKGVGITGYALSSETWHFMAAAVLVGIGAGGSSAWNSLLAESTPAAQHSVVFSLNFSCANASVGVGGLIGAAVAAIDSQLGFRLLYVGDAATSLFIAAVLLVGWRARRAAMRAATARAPRPAADRAGEPLASYRLVFRNPAFVILLVLGGTLFCATYVQLESGLPAFLTTDTSVTASSIALLFAINTGCIIGSQVLLHNLLTTLRHVHAIAAAAALWAVSWVLVFASALTSVGWLQFGLLVVAIAVFAVAETFHAAGMPTLVNELAPAHARGRFNAAYGVSVSLGFIVGPLAAGAFVAGGTGKWFIAGLAVACAALALAFAAARIWLRGTENRQDETPPDVTDQPAERVPSPIA